MCKTFIQSSNFTFEQINKAGFVNLDAVEASAGMCEQARKRGFYGRVINDFVGKNKLDIEDGKYKTRDISDSM